MSGSTTMASPFDDSSTTRPDGDEAELPETSGIRDTLLDPPREELEAEPGGDEAVTEEAVTHDPEPAGAQDDDAGHPAEADADESQPTPALGRDRSDATDGAEPDREERARARLGCVVARRWRLVRVIGVGSMAAVYEARHEAHGRRTALKLMHDSASAQREHKLRFLREANTAMSMQHPNIVQVLDAGRDLDGTLYQVQELLEGEDLSHALSRGPLSPEEVVQIGAQVLGALDEVHAHGFVHRDIKPENIFLERRDGKLRIKLLDFGIAKYLWPEDGMPWITMEGVTLGTPHYMSPEQIRGERLSVRSDIWAVGAVMFYALTGRPPFDAERLHDLLLKVLREPAPSLLFTHPELPSYVVEAVDRALLREPERRWPSARQMARALGVRLSEPPAKS